MSAKPALSLAIRENLALLNATLNEYATVQSKLTNSEVLEKKGRDLSIKIFQGFWAMRAKVTRALKNKNNEPAVFTGPLFDAARTRNWKTKVRKGMILQGAYASLYETGHVSRITKKGKGFIPAINGKRSLTKRALLVAQELATRQRGAGLIGVSFLSRRWRRRDPIKGGKYLVQNRSGQLGIISSVEQGSTPDGGVFFQISNQVPGVLKAEKKAGVIANALMQVRNDTVVYLARKQQEKFDRALAQGLKS